MDAPSNMASTQQLPQEHVKDPSSEDDFVAKLGDVQTAVNQIWISIAWTLHMNRWEIKNGTPFQVQMFPDRSQLCSSDHFGMRG